MGRRASGIFDPDYRKAGWSESRYAPKNSSVSITQISALFAVIPFGLYIFVVPALFPESKPFVYSFPGLIAGYLGFQLLQIIFARWIITREFRRLRKLHGIRTEAELQAPEVKARRASAQARSKAAQNFEREVASLIQRLTGHETVVVGGRGDGGVDIEVRKSGKIIGIVQCKQYDERSALAPGHIRELAAVKTRLGVSTAYLVTTARFSQSSRDEAEVHGVRLIDGARLIEMRGKADERIFGQRIE